MYLLSLNKEECSGCTACESICPKNAISMHKDEEGFLFPQINKDLCIECKLCEKVCPFENPDYRNDEAPAVFAAMHKDPDTRAKSSSGGVFYVIAKWVIEKGGVVYGASFDSKLQLKHIGVDTIEGLENLRGSKYVQSNLNGVFKEIKKHIKQERWVYFVGTGCQVAGLKKYLGKDSEYLITSDLVCHGVPSQKLFDMHIKYLSDKYGGTITDYKFRNNAKWTVSESFNVVSTNGKIKRVNTGYYSLSPYLYSFMSAYTFRHSCYNCAFAHIPRQGDITLADYWGVNEKIPEMISSKGVSLVLVNNHRGQNLWAELSGELDWRSSSIEDGADNNRNLTQSSSRPSIRDSVYKEIEDKGYTKVANTLFRPIDYYRVLIRSFLKRRML